MTTRVVLVEDHRMVREGLRTILEREPDVEIVGEADNGRIAVKLVRERAPDVVLMDVAMLDLNGIEATRQIKSDNPDVEVIGLSSHADNRYVLAMLEAGASGYVLKASAFDELQRAIRVVTTGGRYLSPEVTGIVIDAGIRSISPGASARDLLAPREREVLQLVSEGHTSTEIARRMFISTSTVETHRRNLMKKLSLHSVAELTRFALREGVTFTD